MHRTRGGILAGALFALPGMLAIMALSYAYAGWGQASIVVALFFGLKSAILAVVLQSDRLSERFDGKALLTASDRTHADSERVALWTKADSVTQFDDLSASAP